MKKQEASYTEEFKKEIVALHNNGKSVAEIVAEHKIESSIVCKWINNFKMTHEINIDLKKLIPEYVEWKNSSGYFTPLDYLGIICNYKQLLTISKLLFPDVQLVEGCFFLTENEQWYDISHFTRSWENATYVADLEKMTNYICLGNIFRNNSDIEDLQCKEMTNILSLSWSLYFNSKFPEYDLIVDVYDDEYDGWSVTVYQNENLTIKKPPLASILKARGL